MNPQSLMATTAHWLFVMAEHYRKEGQEPLAQFFEIYAQELQQKYDLPPIELPVEIGSTREKFRPMIDTSKFKGKNVFIGHGRNQMVRYKVKDFIRDRCQLNPLVLEELPSSGMTIIEKLEKYGRLADYAILIFTGDDITANQETRARQNVVQELGWFQGALGRNRIAILHQKGVELFSNIDGVIYLEFPGDDVQSIFEDLRKELEEAGLL